jgi:hypothetical protein
MESMETKEERKIPDLLYRVAVGALIFFVALLVGISAAHAMEIVPSAGITKSADGDASQTTYGLAVRGSLLPMFKHETSIAYRSEEVFAGIVKSTTVPLTESVWFQPIPFLYAGGGMGIYFNTLTYQDVTPIPNTSSQKFGFHVGGGVNFPLVPMISLDLQTRYVFMNKQPTSVAQGSFDPDFWSTSAGIAIHF